MKKIISIIVLSLTILACSSSDDDNASAAYSVFFNFTAGGKDYSTQETYEGIDLCWSVDVEQNGEVTILGTYTDPDDGLSYCGVVIDLTDSHIGSHNDASFFISMGNEAIVYDEIDFELTSNGNYYEGNFNGTFDEVQVGSFFNNVNGSGSFKVPKYPELEF